jgi:hypothetical protein
VKHETLNKKGMKNETQAKDMEIEPFVTESFGSAIQAAQSLRAD